MMLFQQAELILCHFSCRDDRGRTSFERWSVSCPGTHGLWSSHSPARVEFLVTCRLDLQLNSPLFLLWYVPWKVPAKREQKTQFYSHKRVSSQLSLSSYSINAHVLTSYRILQYYLVSFLHSHMRLGCIPLKIQLLQQNAILAVQSRWSTRTSSTTHQDPPNQYTRPSPSLFSSL